MGKTSKIDINKDLLKKYYYEDNLPIKDISKLFNASRNVIFKRLKLFKFKKRDTFIKKNEKDLLFNLKDKSYSYLIGIAQSDGYLNKNKNRKDKGSFSLEISVKDIDILVKLKNIIPSKSTISQRTKNTNFKKNYESAKLSCYDSCFRYTLNYYGVPYGKKSKIIKPPIQEYISIDYWRGIIDGDGALGFTAKGLPFISLVTASDKLAKEFCDFVCNNTDSIRDFKKINKNKRDNVYNIMFTNEDALCIVKKLYYDNCLSIDRKKEKSNEMLKWIRPVNSKKIKSRYNYIQK